MKQQKATTTCVHCGHKDFRESFSNQAINHHEGDELISLEIRVNVCPVCKKQDSVEEDIRLVGETVLACADSERCRRADEF